MLRKGFAFMFSPKLKNVLQRSCQNKLKVCTPLVACNRSFYNRSDDPFRQMENFMKDMEKKLYKEVRTAFPWFPGSNFRPFGKTESVSRFTSNFWGPFDVSTSNTFKLQFNFQQTKEENIKVTLKDRLLSVEAQIEEKSETSSMNQSFSYQFSVPESVDLDSLQSILSHEGVLTIEAMQTPEEAPKTINIHRE